MPALDYIKFNLEIILVNKIIYMLLFKISKYFYSGLNLFLSLNFLLSCLYGFFIIYLYFSVHSSLIFLLSAALTPLSWFSFKINFGFGPSVPFKITKGFPVFLFHVL